MTYKYPLPNAIDEIGKSIGVQRNEINNMVEPDELYALRVLQELYNAYQCWDQKQAQYPKGSYCEQLGHPPEKLADGKCTRCGDFVWDSDREHPNELHIAHGNHKAFVWRATDKYGAHWYFEVRRHGIPAPVFLGHTDSVLKAQQLCEVYLSA